MRCTLPLRQAHNLSRQRPQSLLPSNSNIKPSKSLASRTTKMPGPPPKRPIHLYLDWDGTLTEKDTMAFFGALAAKRDDRLRSGMKKDSSSSANDEQLSPLGPFVEAYMSDFKAHQRSYPLKAEDRLTWQAERDWLESLRTVEEKSVRRVEEIGFFRCVKREDVEAVAKEAVDGRGLCLRRGWERVVLGLVASDEEPEVGSTETKKEDADDTGVMPAHRVSILSVNWSASFIREALAAYAIATLPNKDAARVKQMLAGAAAGLAVYANEIEGLDDISQGSSGLLTGPESLNIRTSEDKVQYLRTHSAPFGKRDDETVIVYVGDSMTDLGSLMAADVGICIRDEPMGSGQKELAATLERLGVGVDSVMGEHLREQQRPEGRGLWWAQDFDGIASFLSVRRGKLQMER